jgi:hypothetical protein
MQTSSMFTMSMKNTKTGPCVVQKVGRTEDECFASCFGCNLLGTWKDGKLVGCE